MSGPSPPTLSTELVEEILAVAFLKGVNKASGAFIRDFLKDDLVQLIAALAKMTKDSGAFIRDFLKDDLVQLIAALAEMKKDSAGLTTSQILTAVACHQLGLGKVLSPQRAITASSSLTPPEPTYVITNAQHFLESHLPNFPHAVDELNRRSYRIKGSATTRAWIAGSEGKLALAPQQKILTEDKSWKRFLRYLDNNNISGIAFIHLPVPPQVQLPRSEADVVNELRDQCITPIVTQIAPQIFEDYLRLDDPTLPVLRFVREQFAEATIRFPTSLPGPGDVGHTNVTVTDHSDPGQSNAAQDAESKLKKNAYLRLDQVLVMSVEGKRDVVDAIEAQPGAKTRKMVEALEAADSYQAPKRAYIRKGEYWTAAGGCPTLWTTFVCYFQVEFKAYGMLVEKWFKAVAESNQGLLDLSPTDSAELVGVSNTRAILRQVSSYCALTGLNRGILTDYKSTVYVRIDEGISYDKNGRPKKNPNGGPWLIEWVFVESMECPEPQKKPNVKNTSTITARGLITFAMWEGYEDVDKRKAEMNMVPPDTPAPPTEPSSTPAPPTEPSSTPASPTEPSSTPAPPTGPSGSGKAVNPNRNARPSRK